MAKKTTATALANDDWLLLAELPKDEVQKLKYLLRYAAENGMVQDGVAVKFGRTWRINRALLPEFLRKETLRVIGIRAAAAAESSPPA